MVCSKILCQVIKRCAISQIVMYVMCAIRITMDVPIFTDLLKVPTLSFVLTQFDLEEVSILMIG